MTTGMNINISKVEQVTVIELIGEVNSITAPDVQNQVLPLAETEEKILLDMTNVSYMSSAGLRVLLALYRQTSGKDGHIVLVGVNEEIQNIMSITGFLQFFTICETVDAGLEAINQ